MKPPRSEARVERCEAVKGDQTGGLPGWIWRSSKGDGGFGDAKGRVGTSTKSWQLDAMMIRSSDALFRTAGRAEEARERGLRLWFLPARPQSLNSASPDSEASHCCCLPKIRT